MNRNRALWIVQGLLAALFLFAGGMKLITPVEVLSVVKETLVASIVRVTAAPGTTDPEGSVTTPVTRDAVPCAREAWWRPQRTPIVGSRLCHAAAGVSGYH